MNLKKSIFSYIIWAAFAVLCCLGIIFALDTAGITNMFGWPWAVVAGAACAYLLLTAAVYFALRTLCEEAGRHIRDRERFERVISVVLPVLILSGAVAYLILYMLYHIPLTLKDDSFYRQAVVTAEKSVPFAVHGASWLYPCLLHVMLLVFGNTPFAGVVLQIIVFFICLLLLYIGMHAFAGTLPAAVSMAVLGFLPVSLQFVFSLTPELFYLALYLSGFCLTGTLFRKFREESPVLPALYVFAFLLGLYIGFLVYLDLYGVSLFLFLAANCSPDSERTKPAFGINLTALSGGAAGFILSVLFASQMGEMRLSVYLKELLTLYTQDARLERELIESMLLPDKTLIGSLLTVSFAFFVIPAFFLWKRNRSSAFMINLFLVYALSAFPVFGFSAQMMMTFSWGILAGLGFYGVVRRSEAESGDETDEKASDGGKGSGKAESALKRKDAAKEESSGKKTVRKERKKELSEKKAYGGVTTVNTEKTITENKEREKTAPGQPLHNPLPVPKKKSRPQADFDHQVREADMKFDMEVADDDDFDV